MPLSISRTALPTTGPAILGLFPIPYRRAIISSGSGRDSPDVIGNSVKFHIKKATVDPGILERLKRKRYWEIKWPPEPDPCLCPEWRIPDFRDFREFLGKRFAGSIVLMKNGVKIQELGKFGGRLALPGSVKANLSREDFSLLKNGGAKFSIAILDGNGSILNESALEQAGQEQLLR